MTAKREVQAKFDSGRQQQSRMTDGPDMYRIAARVLTENIDDRFDADELMETLPLDGDKRNRRARFELRYAEIRISERGTVGRQTVRMYEGTFLLQLHGVWKALQDEQPNAQWKPVAAEVISRYLGRSEAVSTGEQGDGGSLGALYASSMAMLRDQRAQAIGSAKKIVEVADTQLVARIAFADVAQTELSDPVQMHEDGRNEGGSFAQYAQTRNLRHLPRGLQKRRASAIEVIQAYYAERPRDRVQTQERTPVKMPEQVQRGPSFSEAQLEAGMTARQKNVKWADVARLMGTDNERAARAAVLRYIERLANPGSGSTDDDDQVPTDPEAADLPDVGQRELEAITEGARRGDQA